MTFWDTLKAKVAAWLVPLLFLALLCSLGAAWYEGRRVGEYAVRLRSADSVLAVRSGALARAETIYVQKRDTVRVAITRLKTFHDTLNIHDTVQVMHYTWLADSVANACSDALQSCDSVRAANKAEIAALNDKLKLALKKPGAPRFPSCTVGGGIGTAGKLELAVVCGLRVH